MVKYRHYRERIKNKVFITLLQTCIHFFFCKLCQGKLNIGSSLYLRRTSSLHSTTSSPLSLTALHVYTPPSNGQGLRISRVSTPCLLNIRYLASFVMSILFLYHVILGCREQWNRFNHNVISKKFISNEILSPYNRRVMGLCISGWKM